jgi:hypothetical protein
MKEVADGFDGRGMPEISFNADNTTRFHRALSRQPDTKTLGGVREPSFFFGINRP